MMGTVICNEMESIGKYERNLKLSMLTYLKKIKGVLKFSGKGMDYISEE